MHFTKDVEGVDEYEGVGYCMDDEGCRHGGDVGHLAHYQSAYGSADGSHHQE